MSAQKLRFLFVFLLQLSAFGTRAQSVRLNDRTVPLNKDKGSWQSGFVPPATGERKAVLVHFSTLPDRVARQELAGKGIALQEYTGEHTYTALLSAGANLVAVKGLDGLAPFLPVHKIAPALLQKPEGTGSIKLRVTFFEDISLAQIREWVASAGGALVQDPWQDKGLYTITLPSARLHHFAAYYGVRYISEYAPCVPLDLDGKSSIGASTMNMPVAKGGRELRGKDVCIGHGDNCSGIYHIDQKDRVINYNQGDITQHGVLVNGIIGGEGIVDLAGQGIATEGTCVSLFFDAVILQKEELFKGFNVPLTNNSYRADRTSLCGYSGVYDALAQNLDKMAFTTKEQLDIFAAGNDGATACSPYPADYFTISGGFQPAKNILTVASCSRDLVVAPSSSRGPVKDGRLKPEITAPGHMIYCPIPDNAYKFEYGTSLACPQVTGILALLVERYRQLHGNANPQSDLLKAIAMNGASDLGRPGPDYWYGFGLVNGLRSLDIMENNRYTRNTLASGGTPQSITIPVPSNTAQLKVMLYYHDPEASASSSKQLINDLDLTVTEPGGSTTHRPLILDPSPAGVSNNAIEGTDRLNNVEQVSIHHPAAGTYTATVAEFAVPAGPQDYVLVYDIVPDAIRLLSPVANAAFVAGSDLYIYWDAPDDPVNTTKIEFSSDNGGSWTTIAGAVAANTRFYKWTAPVINSSQCKIRISRGSQTDVSGSFMINQQASLNLNTDQCPGHCAVNWTHVAGTDKYYMLLKKGAHFQKVDSVTGGTLTYTFTGLDPKTEYFMSVMPAIGGMDGFRSRALAYTPDKGTCAAVADGDLAVDAILAPGSGRRFTSSELKAGTGIKINVRNQDDNPVLSYSVAYKINAGPWKMIHGLGISANTNAQPVIDLYDFSDTIRYTITVAVRNNDRLDPVPANDTFVKTIWHIPNKPVSLVVPVENDFEALPDLTLLHDSTGISEDGFWDYHNSNDTGRLRSRIPGSKLVTSSRSVSMDVNMNAKENVNYCTGTFNLSAYDTTADEVRFDFEYEMRGMPLLRDSNKVWVRGSDTDPWVGIYTYDNTVDAAKLHQSGTLSLRDIFRIHKQNFSAATQIRFGQFDTTVIIDDYFGGGITIDNVNLYKVSKDLQLTAVSSPAISNCDITEAPVIIKIRNGTVNPMSGITLAYTLDGGAPVTESIGGTLAGDDSLVYTFTKGISSLAKGDHVLKVWVNVAGDDFLKNDTIADYHFYIAPIVDHFPYLQDFENGKADWYVGGRNASWAHGVPSATLFHTAASGRNVWKTSLAGTYNNNELSYLISPCINTSALVNPMLSFSLVFDIEQCDATICDRFFAEYSTDNEKTWSRLGSADAGTNWYNDAANKLWKGTRARWHVASSALPRSAQLKLRFVLQTDMGSVMEGVAIDDIHIFDLQHPVTGLPDKQVQASLPSLNASAWNDFLQGGNLLSSLNPANSVSVKTNAAVYAHEQYTDPVNRQYHFARNWVMQRADGGNDTPLVRLFVTDAEVNRLWSDTSCKDCTRAEDIYRTGVTVISCLDKQMEDSSLRNNTQSLSTYYPYTLIRWVPYDQGYYAEWRSRSLGEFWLNDGGILGTLPLNTVYVQLSARRIDERNAELGWFCPLDEHITAYQLQRSSDSLHFSPLSDIPSGKVFNYKYIDQPPLKTDSFAWYRLLCTAANGRTFYSNIASVQWTEGNRLISVYPIPSSDGNLTIRWSAAVGTRSSVQLTDVSGRVVLRQDITGSAWVNETVLKLGHLAKGIYLLEFRLGEEKHLERIMFK